MFIYFLKKYWITPISSPKKIWNRNLHLKKLKIPNPENLPACRWLENIPVVRCGSIYNRKFRMDWKEVMIVSLITSVFYKACLCFINKNASLKKIKWPSSNRLTIFIASIFHDDATFKRCCICPQTQGAMINSACKLIRNCKQVEFSSVSQKPPKWMGHGLEAILETGVNLCLSVCTVSMAAAARLFVHRCRGAWW